MAYNKDLDKVLAEKTFEGEDGKTLHMSLHSYNGGSPKVQIGPRSYTKKNGDTGYAKAGRLSVDEAKFVANFIVEAADELELTE